jgi:hypothetical protein
MFFGGCAVGDESEMRGGPGEIERRECAEKVSAIDGAETIGEDEVVDDAGPEVVGHAEGFGRHDGELLEAEERVGRQDEGPDLVEVGVGEAEGVEHGGDVGRLLGGGGGLGDGRRGLDGAGPLPEGGFGVDVGEERGGDLSEERVEIRGGGLRQGTRADIDFGDGVVGGGCLAEWPEEGVVLSGGGEALGGGCETPCHAEREAEVDCQREAGAGAEKGAGDGIEDRGVDQAFAGTEVVVGRGEVALDGRLCQGANGLGAERLGFGTEEEAGGGVVFLREFVGVEVVGRGEDPGACRDCGDGIGKNSERAVGGLLRGGVGGGDEDGFAGEGEGEVGERGLEGVLGQRDETDEEAAGGGSRGRGAEVEIGLRGGHRAIRTFSVSVSEAQVESDVPVPFSYEPILRSKFMPHPFTQNHCRAHLMGLS